jgi:polar amino acid transport system substrate-binding protein
MKTPCPRRLLLRSAAVLLAGWALAGCGRQDDAPPAAAASAAAASAAAGRTYTAGTDAAYAPFESQNQKGEIVGFDIEVVQAIAARAGFQVTFVNTPWEGIFNALAQGDRDLLVSAITITPERRQSMDFSDPYFDAAQLIVGRDDSKVAKFTDLKALKVGVQTGTTGDEAVSKLLGKTNTNIRRFESTPLALKELDSGGVDAVVADNGVVTHHVANNPGGRVRTVSDPTFVPERYGIAVKKGNAELLGKINQGLKAIRDDGTYETIFAKYFGPAPTIPAAPGPASAASR